MAGARLFEPQHSDIPDAAIDFKPGSTGWPLRVVDPRSGGFVSESLFPSGPWEGFYNYEPGGKRHAMELNLTFKNGALRGNGRDDVGVFHIRGRYDANGECSWTKTYVGAHDVAYNGFREGKGILGTWEVFQWLHGGFHIWPLSARDEMAQSEAAEQADAVADRDTESLAAPALVR